MFKLFIILVQVSKYGLPEKIDAVVAIAILKTMSFLKQSKVLTDLQMTMTGMDEITEDVNYISSLSV